MSIYNQKQHYSRLFVKYQNIQYVKTGGSRFQSIELLAIIKLVTCHLAVLLKHLNISGIIKRINALCSFEGLSIDYCESIEKKIKSEAVDRGKAGKEIPFIEAYHFFYHVLNRTEEYYKKTFSDVLHEKEGCFISDFMELANQLTKCHFNELRDEGAIARYANIERKQKKRVQIAAPGSCDTKRSQINKKCEVMRHNGFFTSPAQHVKSRLRSANKRSLRDLPKKGCHEMM